MRIHVLPAALLAQVASGRKLASNGGQKLNLMTSTHKLNSIFGDTPRKFPFAHHLNGHRFLDDEQNRCDASFMKCVPDETCFSCFDGLKEESVDWANVDPFTPCEDIIDLLQSNGHCGTLTSNQAAKDTFCATFNSCVEWEEDDDDDAWEEGHEELDCEKLEECQWDNMHSSFIGDGLCHDYECYNTEVCGFDGGDCCEDTCGSRDVCGDDGFFCRDPESKGCDQSLTWECENEGEDPWYDDADVKEPEWKQCSPDESLVFVHKFDSWGDGWDDTVLKISSEGKKIYTGTLKDGAEGKDSLCLKKGCYDAFTNGGVWGNEVSWEVHTETAGPPLAFGGAPAKCQFSVMGNMCENTCNTLEREVDPNEDVDYKSYKELSSCIAENCVIQFGLCKEDPDCATCLSDDGNPFCRTLRPYNRLVGCSMCNCMDTTSEFCDRPRPGGRPFGPRGEHGGRDGIKEGGRFWHGDKDEGGWRTKKSNAGKCNSDQTLHGGEAVLEYSKCTNIEQATALISDWNEDNFGPLDDFEACAHTFNNEKYHGGKKALDCMNVLSMITTMDFKERHDISEIALGIYKNGEDFCDCAEASNALAPSCDSFIHFKVLLHETLDACNALDEIDCAAWSEFVTPCRESMESRFGTVDFTNQDQCQYIEDSCGGVGSFPAFRRLDCGSEISKSAWDFYFSYKDGCGERASSESKPSYSSSSKSNSNTSPSYSSTSNSNTSPSYNTPKSSPTTQNKPSAPSSSKTVAEKSPAGTSPSGYVLYSESELKGDDHEEKKETKHHYVRNFFIIFGVVSVVFVVFKRRQARNSFDFQRYRRQRNYANDQSDVLYSGLTGSGPNTGSSFEPPTLPPTPSEGFS